MEEQKQIRCAIYTRKSTDEGLEKEFNTLEAQREAGENFVMSMKHQGWVILPDHYDDGGFSGGNLKRPALKRLMADVEKGKVDMIVVYMPSEDTADSVCVQYFSDRTWKNSEITGSFEGSTSDKTATVELFGCTDKNQALREAIYMALANRYRRRIVTFSTELEGLIPSYGDLISITHDMPHWGSGGEILSKNDMALTLSEPVEFTEGQNHYLALRTRTGSLSGPYRVDCLAEYLDCTVQELLDKIEEFKEEGCKLFEGK